MKDLIPQIDALFAPWDKTTTPGGSLAILREGEIVYQREFGMANLDHSIPNQSDTVFYIASTSKQFAAAAIALLIEEGKLTLEEDIRKYIPELPIYESPITVRHLVFHTSGLRDYLGLGFIAGYPQEEPITKEQALAMICRQTKLNYAPGEEFSYTNSGYVLISILVERVTGKTLRQYTQEKIFKPLGMEHTHFHDDHQEIVAKRATGYMPNGDGYKVLHPNFDLVGDGGLHTSVQDLFYWDQNFYQNQLGKGGPGLLDLILTRGELNNGTQLDYAFGLFHSTYRGLKMVWHGGAYGGFRAQMMRFPEQQFTIILLCNRSDANPDALCNKIADLVLETKFKEPSQVEKVDDKPTIELQPQEINNLLGVYQSESGLLGLIEFSAQDGVLYIEAVGKKTSLIAQDSTHFKSKTSEALQLEIIFDPFSEGKPRQARIDAMNGKVKDTLTGVTLLPLTDAEMSAYCGIYYCAEIQAFHHIVIKDGQLLLLAHEMPVAPLKMTIPGTFQCGDLKLTFDQEKGYRIDAGRVKRLEFTKQSVSL